MIYELGGIIGVDPGPLTLRELLWMADGRGKATWSHTSALLSAIWTGNPNMKRPRFFRPDEFNPYRKLRRTGVRIMAKDIDVLKAAILGSRGRGKQT